MNEDMLAEYTTRNAAALQTLIEEHGVQPRPFPDDVMQRLRRISDEVVAEMANSSEMARRIHESYSAYKARVEDWHAIAEHAYLNARAETDPE